MPARVFALAITLVAAHALQAAEPDALRYWPQWRGPLFTGVAPHANPPATWSETENVRWKTEIPGQGDASPIVWGDRVFVVTAIKKDAPAGEPSDPPEQPGGGESAAPRGPSAPQDVAPQDPPARPDRPGRQGRGGGRPGGNRPTSVYEFVVIALDRATGKIVWQTKVHEQVPHEGTHPDGSFASPSPVTDGEHVFAYFGSYGLYCLDFSGKVVWKKHLGEMRVRNAFGEGASPALHGDTLVVNWDHEGDDFIVAFDKRTGKERWRTPRDEPTTWATPLIVQVGSQAQVITVGTNRCRSYDLKSGEVIWETGGLTQNCIPSPLSDGKVVYLISGFRGSALKAVRLDGAKGDISGSPNILWTYEQNTPYVPSGLLYRDLLYFLDNNRAMLTCLNARTGEKHYGPERLEGLRNIYASIVAAQDRVYISDRDGATLVIEAGPTLRVIATNKLDDSFDASPAIAGDEIFLRGSRHVYCVARAH
ncbi:MAG: PQQ-binding-like beta-propeller repeat protein [Phycisphaerae bacterium]|nr:PQQ-like beta-propeller repeat protein [Phycisphaerae bacterium]MCZ2399397.1 PQQ-binding-like beta-propeller repeat protein [Phycisphaerae bacterium]